jgi:hypothetical protein
MGRFQDAFTKLLNEGASNGTSDVNDVVDHVQNVLMGPLLENLRAVHPDTPNIEPAIRQIMSGFRELNKAMDPGASKPVDVDMKS